MSVDQEFETIYRESYTSATGGDFTAPDVQNAHDTFVRTASSRMLDTWTSRSIKPGITPLAMGEKAENCLIVPPAYNEFDEADIDTISRVRFLGRATINTAKEQLGENIRLQHLRDTTAGGIFDTFQGYEWVVTHRKLEENDIHGDPDAASPLRLGAWPYGKYLNCLGMSIAMAAACERFGIPYMYGNEIRNMEPVFAEQHTALMKRVRELIPTFDTLPVRVALSSMMDTHSKPNKLYDDILYKTPPVLQPTEKVRDFHHFVVAEAFDEDGNMYWAQIDPFDLTFGVLSYQTRHFDTVLEAMTTAGYENSVVLADFYRATTSYFREFDCALQAAQKLGDKLRKLGDSAEAYKSPAFLRQMYDQMLESSVAIMNDMYSVETESKQAKATNLHTNMTQAFYWGLALPLVSEEIPAAKTLLDAINTGSSEVAIKDFTAKIDKLITQEAEYDPKFRKRFTDVIASIPLLNIVHTYEYELKKVWEIRERGEAAPVMEVADPEFMIGAMYMNHYATWRKGGRINVARHLSRICASQLLWQAARQDGQEVDESVAAMGRVINDLKPRQRHPLVNIASAIPTPTPTR